VGRAPAFPNFEGFHYVDTFCRKTQIRGKLVTVTPSSQGAVLQRSPIVGLPLFMSTPFDVERPNSAGNIKVRGLFPPACLYIYIYIYIYISLSLCILHQKGLKLESNIIWLSHSNVTMTFGSKSQTPQQYKLGEHVVRCLSDLHTTQARS